MVGLLKYIIECYPWYWYITLVLPIILTYVGWDLTTGYIDYVKEKHDD